jgi:hypothetical protein
MVNYITFKSSIKTIIGKSMDLTERTHSISTIPKIPMALLEFKERYSELLDFHLNEYFEHDEISFIKKWFTIYSNGCNLLAKRTDNNLTSIEKRGLEALGTKQYYPNLEFSFGRICDFLKQREQELNTTTQQPKTSRLTEVKAPESKIHFSAMNKAMLSLQLALIDDKMAIQQSEANPIDLSSSINLRPVDEPKPCFKADSTDGIITTLKDYFDATDRAELKRIIETGSNTNEKLLFRDYGNKLSDFFRQHYNSGNINGCTKKELINWIVENFEFRHGKSVKDFNYKTVEKTISAQESPCKNKIM